MAISVDIQIKNLMNRIRGSLKDATSVEQTRKLALEAIDLIVKRTRQGYGVRKNYAPRERLPTLSQRYIAFRRTFRRLSATTSSSKSNVTLTGELLESIGIIKNSTIGARGIHKGGVPNAKLVGYLQQQGRYFLRVSDLEFKQLVRLYQKTFGDLLRKKKLIR